MSVKAKKAGKSKGKSSSPPRVKSAAQTAIPEDSNQEEIQREKNNKTHNRFFEQIFKIVSFACAFLRFTLKKTLILPQLDLPKLKVERRRFIDRNINKDAFADMVYSIPLIGKENRFVKVFIVLEHKSYNDLWTIFQLAYYTMQILFLDFSRAMKENRLNKSYRLPLVVPIIIHHGVRPFTGATQLRRLFPAIAGFTRYLLSFQAILLDLNKVKFEDIPDDPNEWRFSIVIKIMKLVFQENNYQGVEDCFTQILPHLHDENAEHVEFAKLVTQYFWNSAHTDPQWFMNLISEKIDEIEEGEVTDMLTMREQYEEILKERYRQEWLQKGREEGLQTGLMTGRQEGLQTGRQTGRVSSIIKVLSARFGDVPASIAKRLQSIHDDVVLESHLVTAAVCKSMKEFKDSL